MSADFEIKWVDLGREPQCAPNPMFPDGVNIMIGDATQNLCVSELPYPAKRCGIYQVRCRICGNSAAITTAGRPDDPRSVSMPCAIEGGKQ